MFREIKKKIFVLFIIWLFWVGFCDWTPAVFSSELEETILWGGGGRGCGVEGRACRSRKLQGRSGACMPSLEI